MKYGGKTSFHSEIVQGKVKETFLANYGVSNPMFSEEFIEGKFKKSLETTRKLTYIKNWGTTHPMKTDIVKRKIRTTNEESGYWITESKVKDFNTYSRLVKRYTNKNDLSILENIELRGKSKEDYHLDHKYSIFQGYKDNLPAVIIGSIHNLEMLPSGQNLSKNRKCSITKEELLTKII